METFGDRLRAARKALKLTQEDVADEVEVTKSAVSGWENNRETPGLDKLPRLRAVLQQSLDALVCGPLVLPDAPEDSTAPLRIVENRAEYSVSPENRRVLKLIGALPDRKRKALIQLLED